MYGSLSQSNITQSEYQIYFKVFVCILKWIKGFNEKLNYESYLVSNSIENRCTNRFHANLTEKTFQKAKDFSVSLFCKDASTSAVSVPVVIWEKCTSFIFKWNILSRFYEMLIVLTLCEVVTYNLLPKDTMIYKDRLKLRLH